MWATMNKNNILRQKGVTQMVAKIFYKDHNLRCLSKRKNSKKTFIKDNGRHYYNLNDQC